MNTCETWLWRTNVISFIWFDLRTDKKVTEHNEYLKDELNDIISIAFHLIKSFQITKISNKKKRKEIKTGIKIRVQLGKHRV